MPLISYAYREGDVLYHGTLSDLDGVAKSTWTFEEGGQVVTREQPIDEETFNFLCNGITEFGVFQRHQVRDEDTPADPVDYHCIVFHQEPGQQRPSGFMIRADETDSDFVRWIKALDVPGEVVPGDVKPEPAESAGCFSSLLVLAVVGYAFYYWLFPY